MSVRFVLWDMDRARVVSTPNAKAVLERIASDREIVIPHKAKEARA